MTARSDPLTWAGCATAAVGILWLGPLMFDQLVLFGDQGQTADAAAARAVMPWATLLLGGGVGLVAMRGQRMLAGLAGLPVLAVVLAWTMPQAAYQLVAYGLTAPVALGALLAASVPLRGRLHVAIPVAAVVAAVAVVGVSEFGLLAAIALIAWWALSRLPRPAGDASALD